MGGAFAWSIKVLSKRVNRQGSPQNFHPQDKTYQLDLKVRLLKKGGNGKHPERGETVNVEIQTTSHIHFTDRILAYAGRVYGSQLGKGEAYT